MGVDMVFNAIMDDKDDPYFLAEVAKKHKGAPAVMWIKNEIATYLKNPEYQKVMDSIDSSHKLEESEGYDLTKELSNKDWYITAQDVSDEEERKESDLSFDTLPEDVQEQIKKHIPGYSPESERLMNETDSQAIKHLIMMNNMYPDREGYHYRSPADLLLQEGKMYDSQPFTDEERAVLENLARTTCRYRMKECFYNAQDLAQVSNEIEYVEGVLCSGLIPIEHGWNTINGKVIDFTMSHANDGKPILGQIPEGWEYYGVELPTQSIREHWTEFEESNPLLDNWKGQHKMLKERLRRD
jgi:hypothetical protein